MNILVTGGTKGIGLAIIEKFASHGFNIITCARNSNELDRLKNSLQDKFPAINIITEVCDISDKEQVKRFATNLVLDNGLDILINNAGVFMPGNIEEEEEGVYETTMNLNMGGPYHLTRRLLPALRINKTAHIFNLCSTASIKAYPNGGSYCISKFAMMGFTKVLREELKNTGIKVTAVLPGPTLTDSWKGTSLPDERFMDSDDIAKAVWNAYEMRSVVVEEILMRPQQGDI
jgi:short-subunit dehydrogenase